MKTYIGVDPGFGGGIALLAPDSITVHPMPIIKIHGKPELDIPAIRGLLLDNAGDKVIGLEKAGARPGQGTVSMFRFGQCYGSIIGVIETLGLPYEVVRPQDWQAALCRGVSGEPKARALMVALRLFPHVELKATGRCVKPHAGMVDALLIGEYMRRRHGGGGRVESL